MVGRPCYKRTTGCGNWTAGDLPGPQGLYKHRSQRGPIPPCHEQPASCQRSCHGRLWVVRSFVACAALHNVTQCLLSLSGCVTGPLLLLLCLCVWDPDTTKKLQEGDFVVLVQEYAAGGNLFDLLQRYGGRLNEHVTVQMVLEPFLRVLQVCVCVCATTRAALGSSLVGWLWFLCGVGLSSHASTSSPHPPTPTRPLTSPTSQMCHVFGIQDAT